MRNLTLHPFISTPALVFFERLAFFLFITFLYQHLSSDDVRLHPNDTTELLILFVNSAVFSRIFGGLLVDFVLGTKLALLIGLGLQLLGVLMLTTTDINVIYYGMIPYALGQALFMPAILKRNSLNYHNEDPRLLSINYSTFLSIVVAAILVSFIPVTRQYGEQLSDISLPMIFIPLFLALVLTLFTKGNFGKDKLEINQINEQETSVRSNLILFVSILAIVLFYFALKGINGHLNVSDNVLTNLQSMQNSSVPKYVTFGYMATCTLPALSLVFIAYKRNIHPAMLIGGGFGLALLSLLGYYFLFHNHIVNGLVLISCMTIYLMQEGFITPALITMVQRNTNIKYTATILGICLAFSGFLSGYFAEKIFTDDTLRFQSLFNPASFKPIYTGIVIFLVFTAVFLLFYMRRKNESKIMRFEDVDEI